MDYSKIYREVAYFGVWAHDGADGNGRRDALAILAAAVEQTEERDFRHDRDVLVALDYLTVLAGRQQPPTGPPLRSSTLPSGSRR